MRQNRRDTAPARLLIAATLLLAAGPVRGRELLGAWQGWAALRDEAPPRCYAIARATTQSEGATSAPFATIASVPGRNRQVQVHLSRPHKAGTKVRLLIADKGIELLAEGAQARAAHDRASASIVAAMRGAETMRIEGTDEKGRPFRDVYRLAGAASAIDAATLGCLPR